MISPDATKSAFLDAAKRALKEAQVDLVEEMIPELEQLSLLAAEVSFRVARGDENAQTDLAHLLLQAKLLGAKIAVRETNRAIDLLDGVIARGAEILGTVLMGIM
jgi:hypothetical protein